MIRIAIVS